MPRIVTRFYDPTGSEHGIPTYPWRMAPAGLATKRQLAEQGLRPAGAAVAAQVMWPRRRGVGVAYLYPLVQAKPKRPPTAGNLRAVAAMLAARSTCQVCRLTFEYCLPASRVCLYCAQPDRYSRQDVPVNPSTPITLVSFGFLHMPGGTPPVADRVEDVRQRLRDPAAAKDILDLNGFDERVQQVVLNTPGAAELLDNLVAYAELPRSGPPRIAIGCAGGKHRASALVRLLAARLRERGFLVVEEHLHAHLPRVPRADDNVPRAA
ncbi:RRQRL motif-containing zinc-binding protein [Catenulispora pinisilvae]|uniref:RRQRL motif-containing zinc-binding protein n=1 Tax=Catenulispora pinisilvae TaxID=2705253 RepID=UPI002B272B37|nr:RNase adapter RapZ [Catenulispora pinisilvae]